MAYSVIVGLDMMADNVDTKNRFAIAEENINDGCVFRLDEVTKEEGENEVWKVEKPTTGKLKGLWMAYGFAQVQTGVEGGYVLVNQFADPRAYTNVAGYTFDAKKLEVDDVLLMTADCFTGQYTDNTTKFANATNNSYQFAWGNNQTADVTSLKVLKATYITIGLERVPAYKMVVVAN